MKTKLLAVLLLVALCFTSCDFSFDGNSGQIHGELTKLSAPMNIRVDENFVVHWSEVPNAGSYIVQIGDESHQATTTELQYPISSMYSSSQADLYIKVKAKTSSSLIYSDSDWSAMFGPVDYIAKSVGTGGDVVDTVTDSNNNPVDIPKCYPEAYLNDITNSNNYTSFTNGKYNYYVFYMGKICDVALEDGDKKMYQGVDTVLKFSTTTVTYNSLKNSVEKTVSNSSSTNYEFTQDVKYTRTSSKNFGVSAGILGITGNIGASSSSTLELGLSACEKFGFSNTETISSSYEKVVSQEETRAYEETYTFNSSSPLGNYLYVLIGNIDVYNVVVVDKETDEFEIYTFSVVTSASRCLIYLGNDKKYPSQSDITIEFNINDVLHIIEIEPTITIPSFDLDAELATITVDLTPKNCEDNGKYDIKTPISNEVAKKEIDPDMLDLQIFGCIINNDGKYVISDRETFGLGFKFLQSYNDIKLTHCEGSAAFKAEINSDTAASALDTNISKTIEKGAYWVKVHYKSGKTEDAYFETNFMNGKHKDDTVSILENLDFTQGSIDEIEKIEIAVVYEIAVSYTGFLGFTGYTVTNWRYDYTIEFAD